MNLLFFYRDSLGVCCEVPETYCGCLLELQDSERHYSTLFQPKQILLCACRPPVGTQH